MENSKFWDKRYRDLPWLGSGPSSRGAGMLYKRNLIQRVVERNNIRSVVDVGCGDVSWLTDEVCFAFRDSGVTYLGLDISAVVVERNRKLFPQFDFSEFDICKEVVVRQCDLLMCFDALIHQCGVSEFESAVRNLVHSRYDHALISYLNKRKNSVGFVPSISAESYAEFEREFRQQFADKKDEIVFADTVDNGELGGWLSRIIPGVQHRSVWQYDQHAIYELTRSTWLSV